jgi:hypothetical protein
LYHKDSPCRVEPDAPPSPKARDVRLRGTLLPRSNRDSSLSPASGSAHVRGCVQCDPLLKLVSFVGMSKTLFHKQTFITLFKIPRCSERCALAHITTVGVLIDIKYLTYPAEILCCLCPTNRGVGNTGLAKVASWAVVSSPKWPRRSTIVQTARNVLFVDDA